MRCALHYWRWQAWCSLAKAELHLPLCSSSALRCVLKEHYWWYCIDDTFFWFAMLAMIIACNTFTIIDISRHLLDYFRSFQHYRHQRLQVKLHAMPIYFCAYDCCQWMHTHARTSTCFCHHLFITRTKWRWSFPIPRHRRLCHDHLIHLAIFSRDKMPPEMRWLGFLEWCFMKNAGPAPQ